MTNVNKKYIYARNYKINVKKVLNTGVQTPEL